MKALFLILILCLSHINFGQVNGSTFNIKTSLGFGYGLLTENTQTNQGFLNFAYENNNLGFELKGSYYLGGQGDRVRYDFNHQAVVGSYYKFLDKKIHPIFGLQFGLAYANSNEYGVVNSNSGIIEFESAFNPIYGLLFGIEYDINERICLLTKGTQIYGTHSSNSYPTYLDEFRISIGIGFNLINKSTN